MLDYRGIVAAVSLSLYAIFLPFSTYALVRRAFDARFPWIALTLFSILRIVGAALQIALENQDPSNANTGLATGAAICNAVGLGPLLLVATRLLRQCNSFIHVKPVPNQTHRALITFELCTVVSTVITIVGGVESFKPKHISNGSFDATTTLKAGVCLYAATFACISAAAVVIALRRNASIFSREQPHFGLTTLIILVSTFLLTLRIVYSLLSVFDDDPKFSPIGNGNETIQLCLENIPEWLITILYLCIAMLMRAATPPPRERQENEQPGKSEGGNGGSKSNRGSVRNVLRFVPFVHWFIE